MDAYRRRSETLDAMIPTLFVKGLSVRDISDTFKRVFEGEWCIPFWVAPLKNSRPTVRHCASIEPDVRRTAGER